MPQPHASVDAYIAAQPAEVQPLLQQLRAAIRAVAPNTTESISYGIPAYKRGKVVVIYFAGWKKHASVYPALSGDEALQRELSPYRESKGTLRFPLDQPLPLDLIQRAIKARLDEITATAQ